VLSLGAKPRGLKPGYNILILFPKDMCILFYPKFLARGKRAKGMHVSGNACISQGDKCQPWCMQI
jgi:hypothetical protein